MSAEERPAVVPPPPGTPAGKGWEDTDERQNVVKERDCQAVLAIKGEWFPCQEGRHLHPIHGNKDAEVIWVGHDEAVALPATASGLDGD